MKLSIIRNGQFVELTEPQQKTIEALTKKEQRQAEARPFRFRRGQAIRLPVFREFQP